MKQLPSDRDLEKEAIRLAMYLKVGHIRSVGYRLFGLIDKYNAVKQGQKYKDRDKKLHNLNRRIDFLKDEYCSMSI